jgi:hypothetical protein
MNPIGGQGRVLLLQPRVEMDLQKLGILVLHLPEARRTKA